jgi:hypothetical protein
MEEMLVYLVGAGAVLAAPLVPGLRPVIKSVVKGGLVAAEATRGAAVLVGQTWRDIVKQATEEFEAETRSGDIVSSTSRVVIDADATVVEIWPPEAKPAIEAGPEVQDAVETAADAAPQM